MASEAAVLLSWSASPWVAIAVFLAGWVYVRGWRALRRQVPERFPGWRLQCFLGGLLCFYLAVASPLDTFAGFLLQVHMVQHLLLTMVVPPLLLLGAPWLPILRGLPRAWVRDVVGPFLNGRLWKGLAAFFAHPVTSWLLFVTSNVLWHVPLCYDAALRSNTWHGIEHACFLGTALLFWWHVVLPWPSHPHWSRWMAIPYLLLADLQNTALAAFLTFFDRPLYVSYAAVPRLWGTEIMEDQIGAGVIMWVPGSLAFLIPVGIIAVRLLSPRKAVRPSEHEGKVPAISGRKTRPVRSSGFVRLARTPARRIVQGALLLLAMLVVADGIFGPPVASMNLAGVLPWTYWRGFSVIALLVAGNLFCMGCPFILARDSVRRMVPGTPRWRWPKALRNKWSAVVLLVVFFWVYEVFDLWDRPAWTAALILAYFAVAIVVDWLFRGASFCKYLCPIGQYHFVFSTNSPAEIRVTDPRACLDCTTHDCLRGNTRDRGCETHLFQPKKSGNVDCTFCLDCVRACPRDNVGLAAVVPTVDLASDRFRSAIGRYSRRRDIAALFGLFVAGAYVNAAGMTAPVKEWTARASASTGLAEPVWTSALIVIGLVVAPLLVGSATASISRLGGGRSEPLLARFAPAFVPLGAALWASHFLFHLATGAFTVVPVAWRLLHGLGFNVEPDWTLVGFSGEWITALELTLLDLGLLGSLYLAWKISGDTFGRSRRFHGFLPWAVTLVWLFAVAVWLVFQPMDMRGTMLMSH